MSKPASSDKPLKPLRPQIVFRVFICYCKGQPHIVPPNKNVFGFYDIVRVFVDKVPDSHANQDIEQRRLAIKATLDLHCEKAMAEETRQYGIEYRYKGDVVTCVSVLPEIDQNYTPFPLNTSVAPSGATLDMTPAMNAAYHDTAVKKHKPLPERKDLS